MNNILIIGASVSALTFGDTSPGHLLAERWQAPVTMSAHAGKALSEVMPTDAQIRDAGVVISIDGLYWSSNKWPCDEEMAALNRLFDVRDGRPMLLGTIPEGSGWSKGRCADRLNETLHLRCKGFCKLVELNGPLLPPGLHPNRAYMERVVSKALE